MVLAALSLAAAGAGAIGSAVERNKARKALEQQKAESEAMYNQDYYSDYTQRADVQSALGRMRDQMKENMASRRNTSAVTGGTPEAAVAGQKADNEVLGKTVSNIAGQASSYKDSVRNRYLQQKSYYDAQKIAGYNEQGAQWSNFASNAASLAASSAGNLDPNAAVAAGTRKNPFELEEVTVNG